MKTKLFLISLSFISLIDQVSAQSLRAQNPFWSAPMKKEFYRDMTSSSMDLAVSCQNYKASVLKYSDYEVSSSIGRNIDFLRKYPLKSQGINEFKFKSKFVIQNVSGTKIEEEVFEEIVGTKNDVLPGYMQKSAISGAVLSAWKTFSVEYTDQSLMALSNKFNLEESTLEIATYINEMSVTVYGLDLACDLLSGNARIKIIAPGYVKLTQENSNYLSDIYEYKISKVISDTLSVTQESEMIKAAKLGFRLGSYFQEESENDSRLIELRIQALMGLLFKSDSLTPTRYLIKYPNKYSVGFDSGVDISEMTLVLGVTK